MKIAGFIKNSFVDYPSQIASVVFTQGCNLNCHYCHNHQLIPFENGKIDENDVFDFLKQRKSMIDAVVISGGEPTCQHDLIPFIKKIKVLGFLIKLDTNGTNLNLVQQLIENNLLDYVAMDIKAPLEKYNIIVGNNVNNLEIKKSINYLLQNKVDYEFRTTLSPKLSIEDVKQILKEVEGAKKIYFQKCNLNDVYVDQFDSIDVQNSIINYSKKYVQNCLFRGFI